MHQYKLKTHLYRYLHCETSLWNAHAWCGDLERALISFVFDSLSHGDLWSFFEADLLLSADVCTPHSAISRSDTLPSIDRCSTTVQFAAQMNVLSSLGESQVDVRGDRMFYESVLARAYSFQPRIPFTLRDWRKKSREKENRSCDFSRGLKQCQVEYVLHLVPNRCFLLKFWFDELLKNQIEANTEKRGCLCDNAIIFFLCTFNDIQLILFIQFELTKFVADIE